MVMQELDSVTTVRKM